MNISDVTTLITTAFTTLGVRFLTVLGAFIAIGLGLLLFRFGWRKVKTFDGSSHELSGEKGLSRFKKHVRSRIKRGLSISN